MTKLYENDRQKFDTNPDDVDLVNFRYLAYSLDFIDFVKDKFSLEVTFEEKHIDTTEKYAEQMSQAYTSGKMPKDQVMSFAKLLAGHVGFLMVIHKDGKWVLPPDNDANLGDAVKIGEHYYLVMSKAYRRITNGAEDNLFHFYCLA